MNFAFRLSLSLCLLGFGFAAQADKLKFCFEAWEPYAKLEDGKLVGITAELVNEALVSLGHTAEYQEINSANRCNAEVESGVLDGMLFASKSSEGEKKYLVGDVATEYWVLAVIVADTFPGNTFKDFTPFKGKVFGAVSGYEYPEDVSKHMKDWKKDEVTDAVLNLRKISGGRIFFAVDDPAWAKGIALREKLKIKTLEPSVTYDPTYIAFNKKHVELLKKLNAKLLEMQSKGRFDEVYKKHIGMDLASFKKANSIE